MQINFSKKELKMINKMDGKQKKRAQWAWYLYDFGNSAYAAVVLLAVYSAYFKNAVVGGAKASLLWGVSLLIAGLVVAIISPILGAMADYSGRKKMFLFIMTAISTVFTALLFFVQKGNVFLGMLLFIIAEIGYRGGQTFYNGLLTDVADEDEIAKVSGNGWAVGSVGGIICLIIVLAMIQLNPGNTVIVRLSLVMTAVYFLIFAIPAFLWIKEEPQHQDKEGKNYFQIAFERVKTTLRSVKNFKEFIKFMVALLIYNDGIIAALDFAAIIGLVLFGMTETSMIIFVIIVQVTNVIGAYYYGRTSEKTGVKKSLVQSLILMIISVVGMMFIQNDTGFYIVGALAGFAMAGVQMLSRTMVSVFAPEGKSAEFYGFFSLTGRTSSIIGPFVMGAAATGISAWVMNSLVKADVAGVGDAKALVISEQIGHRIALITIIFFLLVGLMPLLFVNEEEGQRQAKAAAGTK
jgi:UMF1 family MFS transporter